MFINTTSFHPLGNPEKFEDALEQISNTLQEIRADYLAKRDQIQGNRDLSAQGKQNQLKELKDRVLKAIRGLSIDEAIERDRTGANAQMTQAFQEEMANFEKQHPVYRFLIEKEIRQHIESLDPAHKELEIRRKVESGDSSWLHALRNDPIPGRIVSQGLIAELTAARAEQLAPDAAAVDANIRQLDGVKQANIKALLKELGINEPVDDWVAKAAKGEKHDQQ